MNRIRRPLARRTGPPGMAGLRASRPTGPAASLPGRPRPDGFARRFIQHVAAAATVAAGHQLGRRCHGTRPAGSRRGPATTATMSRWRTVAPPILLPHTVQLCIHCRQSPAGFWVSRAGGQTVRRPWCLSCCQGLDSDRCDVIPFGS